MAGDVQASDTNFGRVEYLNQNDSNRKRAAEGRKEEAVRTNGEWSDLGRGSALQVDLGKVVSHPREMKARSSLSRVGVLLPLV